MTIIFINPSCFPHLIQVTRIDCTLMYGDVDGAMSHGVNIIRGEHTTY